MRSQIESRIGVFSGSGMPCCPHHSENGSLRAPGTAAAHGSSVRATQPSKAAAAAAAVRLLLCARPAQRGGRRGRSQKRGDEAAGAPVAGPAREDLEHVLARDGAVPVEHDDGPGAALVRGQRRAGRGTAAAGHRRARAAGESTRGDDGSEPKALVSAGTGWPRRANSQPPASAATGRGAAASSQRTKRRLPSRRRARERERERRLQAHPRCF